MAFAPSGPFSAILLSDKIFAADGHGGEILLRLNRAPRFTGWMADVIRPYLGNRVLEIGAGIGNMTLHLVPRSIYWATDINPSYLDSLERLKINRPYLRVASLDATDAGSFPTGESFDTVICLNVVEHLADDRQALRNVWNALEEGGARHRAGAQWSETFRHSGRSFRALPPLHRRPAPPGRRRPRAFKLNSC